MDAVFLNVFNRSISAGWMILAIVCLRQLFRKAPKAWRCVLWGLVGVRLLLPISLKSVLSLIPSSEVLTSEAVISTSPAVDTGVVALDAVVNPVFTAMYAAGEVTLNANHLQRWTFACGNIWRIGMLLLCVYALISYVRLKYRMREAVRYEGNVYQCERASSPFVLGILKPCIYIPYGLGELELSCVLAHERAHIARKDYMWKPLGFAVLMVHWFNPLVWVAYLLFCRDIEFACDERVIKEFGNKGKREYAEALLRCSIARHGLSLCPLAFGENSVRSRIRNVVNYKKPAFWVSIVAVVATVGVGICFLTDPVEETKQIESNTVAPQDEPAATGEPLVEAPPEPSETNQVTTTPPIEDPKFVLPAQAYEEGSSMPYLYVYNVVNPLEMVALTCSNASKTTMQNGQPLGLAICGIGPLDEESIIMEIELEGVTEVKLASRVPLDYFVVKEYSPGDVGKKDAVPLSVTECKGDESILLEQGRIYEFIATWSETNLEENGFYGEANYYVETLYSSVMYAVAPEILEILGDFNEVAKIEVVRGSDGEVLEFACCDGIDCPCQWIIYQCKELYFSPIAGEPEKEEPHVGYKYLIRFLDEEGEQLQSVIPYEDGVSIGGVVYPFETGLEKSTGAGLIKLLKSLY